MLRDHSRDERLDRRGFLAALAGRKPVKPQLSTEALAALALPEEERMMGWMSLRRQLLKAFRLADAARLERYVALSLRNRLELESFLGHDVDDERPGLTLVATTPLGDGAALYTLRERSATELSTLLFGVGALLEADIQVTGGRDWLLRDLRPVA